MLFKQRPTLSQSRIFISYKKSFITLTEGATAVHAEVSTCGYLFWVRLISPFKSFPVIFSALPFPASVTNTINNRSLSLSLTNPHTHCLALSYLSFEWYVYFLIKMRHFWIFRVRMLPWYPHTIVLLGHTVS